MGKELRFWRVQQEGDETTTTGGGWMCRARHGLLRESHQARRRRSLAIGESLPLSAPRRSDLLPGFVLAREGGLWYKPYFGCGIGSRCRTRKTEDLLMKRAVRTMIAAGFLVRPVTCKSKIQETAQRPLPPQTAAPAPVTAPAMAPGFRRPGTGQVFRRRRARDDERRRLRVRQSTTAARRSGPRHRGSRPRWARRSPSPRGCR